jgi:serine/threonine-protein kinase RsbW
MASAPLSRFPARMDSMEEVRAFVEGACATAGVDREECLKVLLIVEELFTNTVTHGYGGESESPVWLAFEPGQGEFTLRYEDAAPQHNPFGEFRPLDTSVMIAQQPVGGLGLKLVRSLATGSTYRREGERNCIRLTFALRRRG